MKTLFHISTGKRASIGPAWLTLCHRGVLSDKTVAYDPDMASEDRLAERPEDSNCRTCIRRYRGGKQHSQYPRSDR